jgi:hypothetical protein
MIYLCLGFRPRMFERRGALMRQFGVGFLGGTVFHCVSKQSVPHLREELERHQYELIYLDGGLITDELTLFQAFRAAIPSDHWPPQPNQTWGGFSDSLTDVLLGQAHDKTALIWTSAEEMLEGKLPLLVYAAQVIGETTMYFRESQPTLQREVWLHVFLVDEGPNFPQVAE